MVADRYPDGGALGGIFTGLEAAGGDAVFNVACDMPFLQPDVVRLVVAHAGDADVVVPRVDGQYETMHALYAKACLPAMRARLEAGPPKITRFFPHVPVLAVTPRAAARHPPPAPASTAP